MTTATQTTEVSAINMMLASIGERPVNDISTTQRLDVLRAVATLNEVNVMVQTRGWWFNAEEGVTLSPNADGEYDIPANVVKVDSYYTSIWKFVQRGRRLYNKDTFSFTAVDDEGTLHTDDLLVNWTVILDFDDLPETAKLYIARRAGVIFQTRSVGSPTLFEFTEQAAQEAWGLFQQEELDQEDINLTYAPGIVDAVYRR